MNRSDIMDRLKHLIVKESSGEVDMGDLQEGPDSLRNLGLSSLLTLRLLTAVEDEFGIEWDEEVDDDILTDLGKMVDHLADELSAHG